MQHKAFGMRRALAVATLLLLLVLAGCGGQTDPATNVTATSATLNGQEWCKAGESGTRWWRYRLGINPWQETSHANWSCSQDRNQSVSTTITGLTPGSHYQYEICWTLAAYPPVCANANGAPDNAIRIHEPMDAFDTKDPASRFFGATSGPPFLNGLHQIWADDASRPDPVQANRWGEYSCGRADGQQQKSFNVHDLYPGEFTQFPSGGPNNAPYYRFHAGQGRNIWTGGTVGRCELGYPGQAHYQNTIWFNNGDHRVILFSTRLPAGWDINQTNWRGFGQVKVDEDIGSDQFYPALGFAQYNGIWGMSHFGAAAVQTDLGGRGRGQLGEHGARHNLLDHPRRAR